MDIGQGHNGYPSDIGMRNWQEYVQYLTSCDGMLHAMLYKLNTKKHLAGSNGACLMCGELDSIIGGFSIKNGFANGFKVNGQKYSHIKSIPNAKEPRKVLAEFGQNARTQICVLYKAYDILIIAIHRPGCYAESCYRHVTDCGNCIRKYVFLDECD